VSAVAEASHAVFLSYASQDTAAAHKIAAALRASAIEVFLDQSELRGGDAWDQRIRHEIHNCALLIPLVSRHTQERLEGYFRHEWKLAIERTHHMAEQKPFLVPVVIDGTGDREAIVPEAFRAVQWTRLPGGETPAVFVERIKRLLAPGNPPPGAVSGAGSVVGQSSASSPSKLVLLAVVAVLAALAYLVVDRVWISRHETASTFNPPASSIAVLPFVNLSGDQEQEYFSDGLTEELLNSLAAVEGLQVAARSSSFSFKEHPDIATVAHKLNVGAVLEGSVRRSGRTVRVTAQLINATTGFHLWSKTYDRDLGDVLKLQTDIATAVADALKVTLLGDVAAKIELGGTRIPAAFDAYLRGQKARQREETKALQDAIAAYSEAIRLDPNYALAFAERSRTHSRYAMEFATAAAIRDNFDMALADAHQALTLVPDLVEGQLALARYFAYSLDFQQAGEAYDRARTLAPGNAEVLRESGRFDVYMRPTGPGLTALRRAVVLDPLNPLSHSVLSEALYRSRRYHEATAAATDAISLDAEDQAPYGFRGLAYYGLGDFDHARASCEAKPDFLISQWCLVLTYDKLGRHAEAQAVLARFNATYGDAEAYQYATIAAQQGNVPGALEWLDRAMRLRDPGLEYLKTDPLMDPLRNEPRFQAVMRELKFPE
jgi:TolB-like protein/cytochrome c-type biogenesis protein CcmH/NrfG